MLHAILAVSNFGTRPIWSMYGIHLSRFGYFFCEMVSRYAFPMGLQWDLKRILPAMGGKKPPSNVCQTWCSATSCYWWKKSQTTTWGMVLNPCKQWDFNYLFLNWWVDPGFLNHQNGMIRVTRVTHKLNEGYIHRAQDGRLANPCQVGPTSFGILPVGIFLCASRFESS